MKKTIGLSFIGLLFIVSCNCNNNKKAEEKEEVLDSVQTASSIASEDSSMIADNNTRVFINNTLQNTGWQWNRFKLVEFWADDSLGKDKKPFSPPPDFYNKYASVLKWSPDSTYLLDIGSYGSVITQDKSGKSHVMAGDPDTEVSLILPKENTKTRLLFSGPSMHIFNAVWADSTEVAMLGAQDEKNTGHPDTLLWLIDVKENFFRKYKWK